MDTRDYYRIATDEQKELVLLLREILEKELAPNVRELDEKAEFSKHAFQKLREAGFYGLNVPVKYGGSEELSTLTECMIFEEFGKVDAGFGFSFHAGCAPISQIVKWSTDENQKKMVCDYVLNGGMFAFGLTEANAGSDLNQLKTTARKVGNEYVLNGTKVFCTNAGLADMFIIFALTDKEKGVHKGMSAFLVERERGIVTGKHEDKLGLRCSNTADVVLDEVVVPASNMIGPENSGYAYSMLGLEPARPVNMSFAVGIAQAALNHSVKFAKERVTFGKPIIDHQGYGFKLADMAIGVQAARSMIMQAAQLVDQGIPLGLMSSATKAFVSETCMQVCVEAVQAHGGYGYCKDYPVEKLMRDAKIYSIFEGTNEIQRLVLSKQLKANVY